MIEQTAEYQELIAAVRTQRTELAWAMLSDYLLLSGHPRGELIALDMQPATTRDERRRLESKRRALFDKYRDLFLGDRAQLSQLSLTWHRAFIVEAVIRTRADPDPDALRELRRHPSAALLNRLVLPTRLLGFYCEQPGAPIRELVARTEPPSAAPAKYVAASEWATAMPYLEKLEVHTHERALFTGLAHSRVRDLILVATNRTAVEADGIIARFPSVRSLSLSGVWLLDAVIEGIRGTPALKRLELSGQIITAPLLDALEHIAHQTSLTELDLSGIPLNDTQAGFLAVRLPRLRRVAKIGVSLEKLTKTTRAKLEAAVKQNRR